MNDTKIFSNYVHVTLIILHVLEIVLHIYWEKYVAMYYDKLIISQWE